ncbi:MAG: hypothetical protein AAF662_02990 [Pseudomonadota bacterium]
MRGCLPFSNAFFKGLVLGPNASRREFSQGSEQVPATFDDCGAEEDEPNACCLVVGLFVDSIAGLQVGYLFDTD